MCCVFNEGERYTIDIERRVSAGTMCVCTIVHGPKSNMGLAQSRAYRREGWVYKKEQERKINVVEVGRIKLTDCIQHLRG